jgi:8-hydroxy-5-deazaflavin:NADPH oxidoreductase
MDIAIIGTGFFGTTLGRALSQAGHNVTLGSRHSEGSSLEGTTAAPIGEALENVEIVILCLPGTAVAAFASEHRQGLGGKLVIDATNKMGEEVANSRSSLPSSIRYVRAFNSLGGENIADPVFEEGRAAMFFSGPEADRATVEAVIEDVGLNPVYVGEDQEGLIDCLFRLWIALAIGQGRGRRLALRLLDH